MIAARCYWEKQLQECFMVHKNLAIAMDRLTEVVHMKNARQSSA
jgi:hypothetical protein